MMREEEVSEKDDDMEWRKLAKNEKVGRSKILRKLGKVEVKRFGMEERGRRRNRRVSEKGIAKEEEEQERGKEILIQKGEENGNGVGGEVGDKVME